MVLDLVKKPLDKIAVPVQIRAEADRVFEVAFHG
jgi:hypothetical protein